ncbi:hypothetical protein [Opitutus sp. ER46]|uniref:NAD(P)/FAD-dependent oxidoreductase n=1 Tax=Opitutus sp. ER46 TaxID=2161864 RepID=UPI000D2F6DD8|nr:hypothetical protein [Opitutus sp. ER46]PTX94548.1 hypothetical protein DB354_12490 [Opitutus sp. ER46]
MIGRRPIEIVGGGLAGLSLGLALQRQGTPTTIHDAGTYPRHRVCGEFIAGLDDATIESLGLAPLLADALRHHEVAWYFGSGSAHRHHLPAPAYGVSRHVLDARLADAFVAQGGTLRTSSRVAEHDVPEARVWANGRRPGGSHWLGLKVHARGLRLETGLEVHLGDHAYVGLARLPGDEVNVCGLFRRLPPLEPRPGTPLTTPAPLRRTVLFEYLQRTGLGALTRHLADATLEPASFCAVAALDFQRLACADDTIRLGDALTMIPPFTGHGMAMAFQSAALALRPLLAYSRGQSTWPEAVRATNSVLRGRFRLRHASANTLHRFVLEPRRQRWFAVLSRARLLPFRRLYALLH